MSASDVLEALIKNEPADGVQSFQSLVRERAQSIIHDIVHPVHDEVSPADVDDDENNAEIVRNAPVAEEKWEQNAVPPSHKGKFTKKADAAGESVHEYAEKKKDAPGTLGKEARLALTFEKQAKSK